MFLFSVHLPSSMFYILFQKHPNFPSHSDFWLQRGKTQTSMSHMDSSDLFILKIFFLTFYYSKGFLEFAIYLSWFLIRIPDLKRTTGSLFIYSTHPNHPHTFSPISFVLFSWFFLSSSSFPCSVFTFSPIFYFCLMRKFVWTRSDSKMKTIKVWFSLVFLLYKLFWIFPKYFIEIRIFHSLKRNFISFEDFL